MKTNKALDIYADICEIKFLTVQHAAIGYSLLLLWGYGYRAIDDLTRWFTDPWFLLLASGINEPLCAVMEEALNAEGVFGKNCLTFP